jgi:hypothetical protein
MAAIDFPDSPTLDQEFTASGQSWVWNGTFWEAALTDEVVGPTGPTGPDGVTGPTGSTGASGGITFGVTNSGSSAYTINGSNNPTLSVIRGHRYIFNVNASGHPFWIQTVSGAYSSGDVYSTGVTNGGEDLGTIIWEVPFDAPDTLYYVCQFHSSMAGTINVSSLGPTGPSGATGPTGPVGVASEVVSDAGTTYALISANNGKFISLTSDSAVTFTVDNSFTAGQSCVVYKKGAGNITFTAGTGVTLEGDGVSGSDLLLSLRYSAVTIVCVASGAYAIIGNVEIA